MKGNVRNRKMLPKKELVIGNALPLFEFAALFAGSPYHVIQIHMEASKDLTCFDILCVFCVKIDLENGPFYYTKWVFLGSWVRIPDFPSLF